MASEEDINVAKKLENVSQNSSVSSHDEAFDDESYGSDVQMPGLSDGFIQVHEGCCRAMYRPSKAGKDAGMYICLNKASCRSHYEGRDHSILRGGHRATPSSQGRESYQYPGIDSAQGRCSSV